MRRYKSLTAVLMAFRDGKVSQKYVENYQRSLANEEKSKKCVKAGANLPSQWGKVVTNEQRLIDNGHFMKTSQGATISHLRELYRDEKKRLKFDLSPEEYRLRKRMGTLPTEIKIVRKSTK